MHDVNYRMQKIHVIGGGTISPIRAHFALNRVDANGHATSAIAYGKTARKIAHLCREKWGQDEVHLHLTKMACCGESDLETNEDIQALVKKIIQDPDSKVLFMPAALVDFEGTVIDGHTSTLSGRDEPRLQTKEGEHLLRLIPAPKVISEVRKYRKDLFLVGFKETSGKSPDALYVSSLDLLKRASCNLVFGNDMKARLNMVVTPEQARYHVTEDRDEALTGLVEMAHARSSLKFTRSTIVGGRPVPWSSPDIPEAFREVMNHCVKGGAYRPFLGKTVGHGAVKLSKDTFLTTIRGSDFNHSDKVGLVLVEAVGNDTVIAHGAKPSVGGQSQRSIFADHPEIDCIAHFHSKIRPGSEVPVRSQREYECGSHECGANTSTGMKQFGDVWAVMLDRHGPNVAFSRNVDPRRVIEFIEANFDLPAGTDDLPRREMPHGDP